MIARWSKHGAKARIRGSWAVKSSPRAVSPISLPRVGIFDRVGPKSPPLEAHNVPSMAGIYPGQLLGTGHARAMLRAPRKSGADEPGRLCALATAVTLHAWHDVPLGARIEDHFAAVIEIPKGSKVKYEIDKETGLLRLDRVLHSAVHYPANYGFSAADVLPGR